MLFNLSCLCPEENLVHSSLKVNVWGHMKKTTTCWQLELKFVCEERH
jgi:hypothetical protein